MVWLELTDKWRKVKVMVNMSYTQSFYPEPTLANGLTGDGKVPGTVLFQDQQGRNYVVLESYDEIHSRLAQALKRLPKPDTGYR